jgi:hypothetical protein
MATYKYCALMPSVFNSTTSRFGRGGGTPTTEFLLEPVERLSGFFQRDIS